MEFRGMAADSGDAAHPSRGVAEPGRMRIRQRLHHRVDFAFRDREDKFMVLEEAKILFPPEGRINWFRSVLIVRATTSPQLPMPVANVGAIPPPPLLPPGPGAWPGGIDVQTDHVRLEIGPVDGRRDHIGVRARLMLFSEPPEPIWGGWSINPMAT